MWLVYAIFAAVIWGLDYALGEKILQSKISPITLLALQMLLGSLLYLALGSVARLRADINVIVHNKALLWILLAALISFSAGNLLVFLSIKAKNAVFAGLVELSYPIFTMLFAWLLFNNNRFSVSTALGSLLIFSGIMVISFF